MALWCKPYFQTQLPIILLLVYVYVYYIYIYTIKSILFGLYPHFVLPNHDKSSYNREFCAGENLPHFTLGEFLAAPNVRHDQLGGMGWWSGNLLWCGLKVYMIACYILLF